MFLDLAGFPVLVVGFHGSVQVIPGRIQSISQDGNPGNSSHHGIRHNVSVSKHYYPAYERRCGKAGSTIFIDKIKIKINRKSSQLDVVILTFLT